MLFLDVCPKLWLLTMWFLEPQLLYRMSFQSSCTTDDTSHRHSDINMKPLMIWLDSGHATHKAVISVQMSDFELEWHGSCSGNVTFLPQRIHHNSFSWCICSHVSRILNGFWLISPSTLSIQQLLVKTVSTGLNRFSLDMNLVKTERVKIMVKIQSGFVRLYFNTLVYEIVQRKSQRALATRLELFRAMTKKRQ